MKKRAPNNRTLTLDSDEAAAFKQRLVRVANADNFSNATIVGDCFKILGDLPPGTVDLAILDPPYNMTKSFGSSSFSKMTVDQYTEWLEALLFRIEKTLKSTATIYIHGDWLSSVSIYTAASKFFKVRNRISWEREKGRGAATNWKNCSEDIWFCTMSEEFTFNLDAVKMRRRVTAPYRTDGGVPKDWEDTDKGKFRDTCPSNLWTDITIPFWSMRENTVHPTQKSEKLIAKLVLASTNVGDMVLDPFLGSGTSSVVAKKLGRNYCGIEIDESFALLAEKRLSLAETDTSIQGYYGRVFWDRNAKKA